MAGKSETVPERSPLTDSPRKTNFDADLGLSSTPPPVPFKDITTLPSTLAKTFGTENVDSSVPLSLPSRLPQVHKTGSIGRNAQRLKKLPSLHEIGKVYAENGGSPVNRYNPSFDQPPGPLAKRPILDRLLPVPSSLSQDKQEGTDKLSPYTTGSTAESPGTRLKVPLSALSRMDTFKSSSTTIDRAAKGIQGPIGVPAPRASRQTTNIQIPVTDPTQRAPSGTSTPGISASTSISSAGVTPLITPHSGNRLGALDGVKIVGTTSSAEDEHVKGYTSWKEDVSVGKSGRAGEGVRNAGQVRGDSATVGQVVKPGLHPLQHLWTLYYDTGRPITEQDKVVSQSGTTLAMKLSRTDADGKKHKVEVDFESRLLILGEFKTVGDFGWTFGQTPDLKRNWPSNMSYGGNLHLFKNGIRPMYEDPGNKQGGRWTLILASQPGLLDRTWQNLVCGMIGEQLDEVDDICGAVISIRPKVQRIQVWLRNKNDFEAVERIGQTLLMVLDIGEPGIVSSLVFEGNLGPVENDRPHLQIGKGAKFGPRLAQPRAPSSGGVPGPLSRTPSLMGSAPSSRRNSPTQSGFMNPFAGPLGLSQPASPRTSSSLGPGKV